MIKIFNTGNVVEQLPSETIIKKNGQITIRIQFRDKKGALVNLNESTIKVRFINGNHILEKQAKVESDYSANFLVNSNDIVGSDNIEIEFLIKDLKGDVDKFPSGNKQRIRIVPILNGDEKEEVGYIDFGQLSLKDNSTPEEPTKKVNIQENKTENELIIKSQVNYNSSQVIQEMQAIYGERKVNISWYAQYAIRDSSGKIIDWGPAIRKIVSESDATTNVSYGKGVKILLGGGSYPVETSINNINTSNLSIEGLGYGLTNIVTNIDDGSGLFKVECLDTGHLNYFRLADLTLSGNRKNAVGVYVKKASVCTFSRIRIRDFANHGMYLEEVYDSYFYGVMFTGNGKMSKDNNPANSNHALYIYNGPYDNSNRLIFISCHFEANYGSHVYSNSKGNSRRNSQLKFIGCKFHGLDPDNLANCPNTPHVYLDADLCSFESSTFFQCNNDFIVVNGVRNKLISSDFNNSIGHLIKIIGDSAYTTIIGCTGNHWGQDKKAIEDISSGENFLSSYFTGYAKKIAWGNKIIGEDGGRLAIWFNMYRSNLKYQLLGNSPSFSITMGSDGFDVQGAAASGESNSVIALNSLLSVNLNRIRASKPVQLIPIPANEAIPNNAFFVDSSDNNKLKFKDNAGVIRTVNLK
ncbi:hypothetical protein [Priestia megaterium]|uniref:hypothetical protein n=1 Tax=Priestia megaterium TaxID=1404 RepID=UPI002877C6FD|nr:hypothetical protein [Priestia megaterium]